MASPREGEEPLGQILTPFPGSGTPHSAAQNYATNFGGTDSSSSIWAAVHYTGEEA